MEIGSAGNLYTVAPGTANSSIRPEADLSFEESNDAVDNTLSRVDDAQETQQAAQDLTRQTSASLVEAQLQQNNIERYIEASTDQEVNNNSLPDANDVLQAQQTNQLASSLSDTPIRENETSLQDQLQERINNIVDEGSDAQSPLDILA